MRERINRLAKGIIDSEVPAFSVFPEKVEEGIEAGVETRGELMVVSSNGLHIKGLVYSSNARVQVVNSAFGGLRNRIVYEVDSRFCEYGTKIEGSFYLVTNGGEKEIPYSLCVQAGTAGVLLERLKTADDFGRLARQDLDQALRLFEYQDFTEAPFMQDARCRCIYDGLKGRPGRRNLLEEFLVALKVKEPVQLVVDTSDRVYENPLETIEDQIEIQSSGWGYVSAEITTDEDFIELLKSRITDRDFSGGKCRIYYRIRPSQLHRGKNFGRIRILALKEEFTIAVEAEGDSTVDITGCDGDALDGFDKDSLYHYLSLRLNYETGIFEPALLLNQMLRETDRLHEGKRSEDLFVLMAAELLLLGGKKDGSAELLEQCGAHVEEKREKRPANYCFYLYLKQCLEPTQSGREGLIRLLNRYLEQDVRAYEYLFLVLLKTDDSLRQNPLELYNRMKNMYQQGCSSPFLYLQACRLLEAHPQLLTILGDFEVQALYLGARRGVLNQELIEKAAGLALNLRHYRLVYERFLMKLYELSPVKPVLEAVCSLLIKGDKRGTEAFAWYEQALEGQINLTRLYEYFLYSMPSDYDHLLPREVLLYFSYDKDLDDHSRSVLYKNILQYMNPESELYQAYMRPMEQFAMEQLFKGRINSRLAVLYEHMIYKDMIDRSAAKVLPEILRSCKIRCRDRRMKYVIVRYEELKEDRAYLLEDQIAYVPVFSDRIVFMFQDAFGNRYADVKYWKVRVMDKPELLEQCCQVYPEHTMLRLERSNRILQKGIETDEEAAFLEEIIEGLELSPVYQKQLSDGVVDYYCQKARTDSDQEAAFNCAYLVQMDKSDLSSLKCQQISETLISQNYIKEAYELASLYGWDHIGVERRLKLCTRMVLQNLFDQDTVLLNLAYGVFREEHYDSVVLDYLCEHFNGTVSQMYQILITATQDHVETYDLEERLLAQMLFTGITEQMDSVFELYVSRKKTRESVIKAYFTQKCIEYFLENQKVDDRVFGYLESAVNTSIEKDKIPTIYLLALTRYYASKDSIKEGQVQLCRLIEELLIREGLIFPYTRELARHISIPEQIMDKAMIEYRGKKDGKPEMLIRIRPDEEQFHSEEISRVYQGIFVKQKVLFEGETLEYQIYDVRQGQGEKILAASGQISCDHKLDAREYSRFALLNSMGAALAKKDEAALKDTMADYLKKAAVLSQLFPIV